jgi:hypothetical protein
MVARSCSVLLPRVVRRGVWLAASAASAPVAAAQKSTSHHPNPPLPPPSAVFTTPIVRTASSSPLLVKQTKASSVPLPFFRGTRHHSNDTLVFSAPRTRACALARPRSPTPMNP